MYYKADGKLVKGILRIKRASSADRHPITVLIFPKPSVIISICILFSVITLQFDLLCSIIRLQLYYNIADGLPSRGAVDAARVDEQYGRFRYFAKCLGIMPTGCRKCK